MRVCLSRFTPGLKNAKDVGLQKGDVVTYRLLTGSIVKAKITSELMSHRLCPFGYEGVFEGETELSFMDETRIIDWNGKCETEEDLKRAMANSEPGE